MNTSNKSSNVRNIITLVIKAVLLKVKNQTK